MKILILMLIVLSINFMFMKHPLSMGFILLLSTIFASLTCGLNSSSYFMSYILYMIFIGGMMILFMYMYMSSIASNEKFYFSMKLMLMNIMLFMVLMMLIKLDSFNNQSMMLSINTYNEYCNFFMNKFYMLPSGNITLMMIIYLLFTLIVVLNIIKMKNIPLCSN